MDTRVRHLLKIGLLANAFEWYEFSIVGFLVGQLGHLFFQANDPIAAVLKGSMMFAMSYLMRPIGGLCFGLLGDRVGNHIVLRYSLILMAIPTVLIGFLPTHDTLGIMAPILLLLLRLVQGFSMAGELPSSARYVFENAAPSYRSLICSVAMSSTTIGVLMGSCVISILLRFFDQAALLEWAWRIPFWTGIPLTLFINYVRQTIDTAAFAKKKSMPVQSREREEYQNNLFKPLLKATMLISFSTVCFYTFIIWMPTYLHYFLGIASYTAQLTNTTILVISLFLYPVMGYYAQHFGYARVFSSGTLAILVLILPLLKILSFHHTIHSLLLIQLIFIFMFVMINSVTIEMMMHLFPFSTRSLGVSLAWSVPPSLIGSTTPLLYSYVIDKTGWYLFPAFYIIFLALLALPIALSLKPSSLTHED